MKLLLKLTLVAVIGSFILGCGEMNDEEARAVNGIDEVDVDVELEIAGGEYYYEPDEITVEAGSEVRIIFVNEGDAGHDLVIDDVGGTEIIEPGGKDSFVFTAPEGEATLVFYCSIGNHRELGMEGEIEILE